MVRDVNKSCQFETQQKYVRRKAELIHWKIEVGTGDPKEKFPNEHVADQICTVDVEQLKCRSQTSPSKLRPGS